MRNADNQGVREIQFAGVLGDYGRLRDGGGKADEFLKQVLCERGRVQAGPAGGQDDAGGLRFLYK